jgi:hypothetical protein
VFSLALIPLTSECLLSYICCASSPGSVNAASKNSVTKNRDRDESSITYFVSYRKSGLVLHLDFVLLVRTYIVTVLQLYFDFISFSQFATISNEMRTGEVVFEVCLFNLVSVACFGM